MKILVLSDLHIGLKDWKNNDFLFGDSELANYMNGNIKKYDHIILNGDILELWQSNFLEQTILFHKIVEAYPLFFTILKRELETKKIIYVTGNHDPIVRIKKLLPSYEYYLIDTGHVKIYFEHGHKADFFNYNLSAIGRYFTLAGGIVEEFCDKNIDEKFEHLSTFMDNHEDNSNKKDLLESYGYKLAEKYGYDAVILSHTHSARLTVKTIKDRQVIYANTGSGIYKRNIDETIIDILNDINITVSSSKFSL